MIKNYKTLRIFSKIMEIIRSLLIMLYIGITSFEIIFLDYESTSNDIMIILIVVLLNTMQIINYNENKT